MDTIIELLNDVLGCMPQFVVALILLFASKLLYDLTTPYKFDDELTEKDNPAFGTALAGYMIGTAIALRGALFGTAGDLTATALIIGVGGIAVVVLMRISVLINDKLILRKFDINKEMIEDRNLGTGFVVAGSCIATGLMLDGALSGTSEQVQTLYGQAFVLLRDITVYWALGQTVLVIGALVFQAITSYDIHKVIGEDDNVPAGISFGGFLVALGLVVRASLAGADSDILGQLPSVVVVAVIGLILLACTRVIADKIFLPKSPLTKEVVKDKNPAAGAIAAASFICVAALLAAAVAPAIEGSPAQDNAADVEQGDPNSDPAEPVDTDPAK